VTPFHNMCLVCPDTTEADVDRLIAVLDQAAAELREA
jgi:glutamate-1-semialdehyde 2,1-aminomutase